MNNWKEQLNELVRLSENPHKLQFYYGCSWKELQRFIETEIIEKLIEEIPEDVENNARDDFGNQYPDIYLGTLKEQLRAKWLGNQNLHE